MKTIEQVKAQIYSASNPLEDGQLRRALMSAIASLEVLADAKNAEFGLLDARRVCSFAKHKLHEIARQCEDEDWSSKK